MTAGARLAEPLEGSGWFAWRGMWVCWWGGFTTLVAASAVQHPALPPARFESGRVDPRS